MTVEVPSPDDHVAYRAACEQYGQAYVPGFVQRQPDWTPEFTMCPGCMYAFHAPNVPKKSRTCPACGDRFWIRTCPDDVRRTLNQTAMIEVECLWAEIDILTSTCWITVTNSFEEAAEQKLEVLKVQRRIARGRVLHKHGRGPMIDAQGDPVVEGAPEPECDPFEPPAGGYSFP